MDDLTKYEILKRIKDLEEESIQMKKQKSEIDRRLKENNDKIEHWKMVLNSEQLHLDF